MKDQLISYETAVLAKEKGFIPDYVKTPKLYIESGLVDQPTQSLLQRWLREVHKIRVFVVHGASGNFNYEIRIFDKPNNVGQWTRIGHISSYDSYEQVLEAGLLEALKLIKNA